MDRHEIQYAARAETDLFSIGRSIEDAAGSMVADRFLNRLIAAVETLGFRPQRQRLRTEFGPGMRVLRFRSYMIFYVSTETTVHVVRVLHGKQNITAEMLRD